MSQLFADFAFRYSRNYNLSVFPCQIHGKLPLTKTGFKEATKDENKLQEWAKKYPSANIGIATGHESGIWVLDLDGEKAEAWLVEMTKTHGELPPTPEVKTQKGRHIYFKLPEGVNVPSSASRIATGVDTRGNGGYVIAPPSVHPDGGIYKWHDIRKPKDYPFEVAPEWLMNLVIKKEAEPSLPVKVEKPKAESNSRYVKKVIDEEYCILKSAPEGQRNQQLFKSVAAMANYLGKDGVTQSVIRDLAIAGAKSNGLWTSDGEPSCIATIESGLRAGMLNPKEVPPPKYSIESPARPALMLVTDTDSEDDDWRVNLIVNDKGIVKKSFHNGLVIMENHPLMRDVLIYNAFSDLVILDKCPPWEKSEGWKPRPIRDDDATAATCWLETTQGGGLSLRPHDVYSIMLRVAKKHEIDPPREWLESLQWDGNERLGHWLTDYMQAEDNAYTQTVGRKFIIGAVKRIMEPGCKMDSMLILEGEQGKGKSTALQILGTFGKNCYFTDQVDDINNKDALIQIQGVSIIEFAEMDTLNKSDTDHIKKFITRQIDRYRPPYGKTLVDRPRRCVFAGTVNPKGNGYLKDATGARRFWPVAVKQINLALLSEAVEQLWAEAVVAYKSGEKNWIDDQTVIAMATNEQALRYEEEPWTDLIEEELKYVETITTQQLMNVIDIPKERRDRRASNRISDYLRHKGWVAKKDLRVEGSKSPQRQWHCPTGHIAIQRPPKQNYWDQEYV